MLNELEKKRSIKVHADRPVEAAKIEQTKTAPLYFDPLKAAPYQKHGDECDRRWWRERWLVWTMRQAVTCLRVFFLTFIVSSTCYAQADGAQNKKACDFITKSDAESILGQPVEAKENNPYECSFVEPGWAFKVPKYKQVYLNVRFWASPQPNNYAEERKLIFEHRKSNEVVKEVPNFADGAIWEWFPDTQWGSLNAFKGGTIQVVVRISGIPEDAALQHAKDLAARPLGGAGGTSFVYQKTLKSSQPVVSAPRTERKGQLVRKSKDYWFHNLILNDDIKQIFDGEFGNDVGSSSRFRILFNTYVEMFSKKCKSSLPPHHETIKGTQSLEKKDRYGNVVSRQGGQSWTVEVDSRFAPKYRAYSESLGSTSAETLGMVTGIMSGRVQSNIYFELGKDMIQFFKTESCQSAAMHQLGENLLRGAQGKPSLQAVGAKITGTTSETDIY